MKPDTERKKYHKEKLHKRKKRLHSHLSKELRSKLKNKKRAVQVRKGDTVKIMRGPGKGKQAKVSKVSTVKRKVYVEGVNTRTAGGRENLLPLEPSNLLLVALESTKERKALFSEDIFKKAEKPKKEEPKKTAEEKAEAKKEEPKKEMKEAPKAETPKAEKKEAPEKPKAEAPKAPEAPSR